MSAPRPPPAGEEIGEAEMKRLVAWDRHMGLLSLAMWGGTAIKVAPKITNSENVQAWAGVVIIFAIAVAWPTLGYASYVRWRNYAVSVLRIVLFALPFNWSLGVFNALAPAVHRGRHAVLRNIFELFMSIRIALLNFTSMGWRVPFRLHLLLQTVNVCLLTFCGMPNYLQSTLLSSREVEAASSGLHSVMAFLAMVLVPSTGLIVPEGSYAKRVGALLFCWASLGWLAPSLMLLPEEKLDAPQEAPPRRAGVLAALSRPLARLGAIVERGLRMLLPSWWARQQLRRQRQQGAAHQAHAAMALPPTLSCLMVWWTVLLGAWGLCCTVAPLFKPLSP